MINPKQPKLSTHCRNTAATLHTGSKSRFGATNRVSDHTLSAGTDGVPGSPAATQAAQKLLIPYHPQACLPSPRISHVFVAQTSRHSARTLVTVKCIDMGNSPRVVFVVFCGHAVENSFVVGGAAALGSSRTGPGSVAGSTVTAKLARAAKPVTNGCAVSAPGGCPGCGIARVRRTTRRPAHPTTGSRPCARCAAGV